MTKTQIELPVVLPQVPDEKDSCVNRLMEQLQTREGIVKVHLAENSGKGTPVLCFHYNSEVISLDRIQALAKSTGAEISDKFGHLLLEVNGIRHVRHAGAIEEALREVAGVMEAAVSGSGLIRLEFEKAGTSLESIESLLQMEGLELSKESIASLNNEILAAKEYQQTAPNKESHSHKNGEPHEAGHHHAHSHGSVFGKNTELIFSIISGALLAIGFVLSFIEGVPPWGSLSFYIGAYFFGGYYTSKEAVETLSRGGFQIDFLMLVAAIGAAILGKWAEGALLLFLFSLGHALEHYAMNKARKSIAALAELAPKTAFLKRGTGMEEVAIQDLNIGDIIVVKANTKIAADGVVVSGSGSVNQAPITGESIPVEKVAIEDTYRFYAEGDEISDENRVYAGTLNGNNTLEVKVIKEAKDSTLARLVKLVSEAQTRKSPTQLLTNRFEKYFVPLVLILVGMLHFAFLVLEEPFSASFYRAMAVLVAASPCALAISTPSAVLSGIARAARGGVLIKGGRPLEDLGEITALAFDKTGTLTHGNPRLTHCIPFGGIEKNELLQIAVAVEQLSDHPLAKAVVRDAGKQLEGIKIQQASHLEEISGKGIKARLGEDIIWIGNLALYSDLEQQPSEEIKASLRSLEAKGNTTMLLRKNGQFIGVLALMDTPRKTARQTLLKLKELGIKRMIMLTGDNQKVADAVAMQIGITDAWGSLLPEEKVAAIKILKEEETKVAMVGDGVNDAPAMAHSTVGIAMGAAGSDVALETADVALMANRLENLPFAIGLSRKVKAIIRQNLWVSLGVVALLVPATLFGFANIGVAVVIHEGSTILVVFNALRLLAFQQK